MKLHRSPFIVVFDFGTSSGRCLLIDREGAVLASSQEAWRYQHSNWNGQTLWSFDPVHFWSILASCCKKALATAGVNVHDAVGVITTSQRHGAVLLDRQGQPIDAIPNMDLRTTAEWDEKAASHSAQIYEIAGRWPQPVFLPAHLDWIQSCQPQKYARIGHLLSILDWMVYSLCGAYVSEPTAAADLLLLDVERQQWDANLQDWFSVDPQWLPAIRPSGSIAGTLHRAAATATGLPEGIPVLVGGADTQLGVIGLGCTQPNALAIIMGSSVPLQLVVDKPLRHAAAATWTNPHIIPNQWVLESNAGDAGLFQNNIAEKVFRSNPGMNKLWVNRRKLLEELDARITERRKAQVVPLLASIGPMIFNGKLWPQVSGMVEGVDVNDPLSFEWADFYLAFVDNIAYAIKGNYQQLEAMQNPIDDVRAGGGSMNSRMWQTFLPNVLGTSLRVPKEKEVTSLGAALLAFVSLGVYRSFPEGVEAMIRWDLFEPEPAEISRHDQRFYQWLDLYQLSIRRNHGIL